MSDVKNILVPTDFSEYSDRALAQAADIAGKFKAKIYLLHVIDDLQQCAVDYCISEEVMEQVRQKSEITSREKLQKEVDKISAAKGIEVVFDVKVGRPYDVILEEQKSNKIDLIVIGSHGRTGLIKHLIGSVAEKIVRHAGCPVLVVRA
ncbi:MAG: universal stress protein [Smithellaceae bacterium]|nr:universal stress protein [Smithellaceae bacterium]